MVPPRRRGRRGGWRLQQQREALFGSRGERASNPVRTWRKKTEYATVPVKLAIERCACDADESSPDWHEGGAWCTDSGQNWHEADDSWSELNEAWHKATDDAWKETDGTT